MKLCCIVCNAYDNVFYHLIMARRLAARRFIAEWWKSIMSGKGKTGHVGPIHTGNVCQPLNKFGVVINTTPSPPTQFAYTIFCVQLFVYIHIWIPSCICYWTERYRMSNKVMIDIKVWVLKIPCIHHASCYNRPYHLKLPFSFFFLFPSSFPVFSIAGTNLLIYWVYTNSNFKGTRKRNIAVLDRNSKASLFRPQPFQQSKQITCD